MEELSLGIGSRVEHPEFGKGVVIQVYNDNYEITFMDFGVKAIARSFENLKVTDYRGTQDDLLSFREVRKVFKKLLDNYSDIQQVVPLSDRWLGGKIVLVPGRQDSQSKEIPIDTFFHKIVMLRDRLRVMEQKINASKGLNHEEKVSLQQYITRVYGSLTTFNVLFTDKEDFFIGDRSK